MDFDPSLWSHLLWLIPLGSLLYVSSPRFRGDIAENRVRRALATHLERSRYTVLNDLDIPAGGGTVPIDHVVLSKFGIFVIESQYRRGRISGTAVQERWQQHMLRRTRRFDNPMHRNYLQQKALAELLGLPSSRFHPVVVLTGHKGFKSARPENVVDVGRLVPLIRKKSQQVLTADQVADALRTIRAHNRRRDTRQMQMVLWLLLAGAVAVGAYVALGDDVRRFIAEQERSAQPEKYHPDGRPKSDRERWEDSLICAYSPDTGRCSCYEPEGARADLPLSRCRELAERGSVVGR